MVTNIIIVSSIPKTVKVAADDVVDTTAGEAGGFIASPSSIIFTNYIPGQTYTVSYRIITLYASHCMHVGSSSTDQ